MFTAAVKKTCQVPGAAEAERNSTAAGGIGKRQECARNLATTKRRAMHGDELSVDVRWMTSKEETGQTQREKERECVCVWGGGGGEGFTGHAWALLHLWSFQRGLWDGGGGGGVEEESDVRVISGKLSGNAYLCLTS